MQEEIKYSDIMSLGFKEEECNDSVYFNEYGYQYCITTINLTKRIYIDWEKSTRLCEMVRTDKKNNILSRMPINDLDQLKTIVDFFK